MSLELTLLMQRNLLKKKKYQDLWKKKLACHPETRTSPEKKQNWKLQDTMSCQVSMSENLQKILLGVETLIR